MIPYAHLERTSLLRRRSYLNSFQINKKCISNGIQVRFNEVEVAIVDGGDKINMLQSEYISKIEKIKIRKKRHSTDFGAFAHNLLTLCFPSFHMS